MLLIHHRRVAFIPLAVIYWTRIGFIARIDVAKLKGAFTKPEAHLKLVFVAYLPCLLCIVAFVWGLGFITPDPIVIALTVVFVIVNPTMEELYWRKYLLTHLPWKSWAKIAFSTALFAASHPLMWGIFSLTLRSRIMVMPLLVMGVLWGIVYLKTKSLRHNIIAHALVDVLNLSIWVFLNIYVPPVVGA